MRLDEFLDECELYGDNESEVFIEFNGVVYDISDIQGTSQGVILIVDTQDEDRDMHGLADIDDCIDVEWEPHV
jgi:predicted heme/steroid binding protein